MYMQSTIFRSPLLFWCANAALLFTPGSSVRSEETLKPITLEVADQQVQFVRLPEQPDVNLGKTHVSGKLPVVATYMMSTELTAAVMKELIGNTLYNEYLDGLMLGEVQLPDHKSHKEKLYKASGEIAVCSVPIEHVIRCSEKLQELVLAAGLTSKVETVKVRIPTAAEWKYAMLGSDLLDGQRRFPQFPSWPPKEDVRRLIDADSKLKGYVSDLQEQDPKYTIEAFASQDRFIEFLKQSSGDKNKLPSGKTSAEILGELLGTFLLDNSKLGLMSNPATPGAQQRDYDPSQGVANDFGLLNMYNNLSEWVLLDSETVDADWELAVSTPQNSKLQFFAIGPTTFVPSNYDGGWRWLSLRDPYPEDQGGKQKTLTYQESNDPNGIEFFEGVRLLLVRRMAGDWFATMRAEFLRSKDGLRNFDQFADEIESSISEVVAKGSELEKASSMLNTYRTLANVSETSPEPVSSNFFALASVGYTAVSKGGGSRG
jgi:hypothetical protein